MILPPGRRPARAGSPRRRDPAAGFSLIELLVVVAVISILAAIAVVNMLEAQVRSKVSRAKADMRSIATALEAFAVDKNQYPGNNLGSLTEPVAYISAVPEDPFRRLNEDGPRRYRYGAMPIDNPSRWVLASVGPDRDADQYLDTGGGFAADSLALRFYPGYSRALFSDAGAVVNASTMKYVAYDPTNGTVSDGDVYRMSDFQSFN